MRPVSADSRQFPYTLEAAITGLSRAHGGAPVRGRVRASAGDFHVTELPLIEPVGEGEHAWLRVRKREENTATVAGRLAQLAGVPLRNVGYAGLKDRNAVTEQWFSVHLPGRADPDWRALESDRITLLQHTRHTRKLRRGALQGNAFRLRLRELSGDVDVLSSRLQQVAAEGVPNYFGEQRFGRDGSNLQTADRLFSNPRLRLSRNKRSLALSAARSLLFNQVLSARVAAANWNVPLAGDAMQLHGSHSYFIAAAIDADLSGRVAAQDVLSLIHI